MRQKYEAAKLRETLLTILKAVSGCVQKSWFTKKRQHRVIHFYTQTSPTSSLSHLG